jgi:2-polyprenyl-3-methyl-5-hydroxy-6-metoxy-1,4-benzoquinol methylase
MDYSKTWLYHQTDNRDHLLAAKKRLDFVVRKIQKLNGVRAIIDIGFGDGYLLKALAARRYDVHGIDFIEENVRITRQATGLGEQLKTGSVTEIPFEDHRFDAAIATEMFEHLTTEDLEKGLREIHRTLKKGGYLLITVPYAEDLSKKMACCPKCGCEFHLWGHQQSFNDDNLHGRFAPLFSIRKIEKLYPMAADLNIFGHFEVFMRRLFKKYKGYFILLQAQ